MHNGHISIISVSMKAGVVGIRKIR
uniref:Uncharacterized protein n=1 Tax=Anguilla anguilla TaxID=7936 RepID=A0A0E9VY86_ANGAN